MKAYYGCGCATQLLLFTAITTCTTLEPTTSSQQYPADCIASATEGDEKGIRSLRCKSFPYQVPDTVVYLIVKRDSPDKLDATNLAPLSNLKMLNIQGTEVEDIEDDALATIPGLEVLNLATTKIMRLTNYTFFRCANLVELNLDHVKLKHIQLGAFVPLRSLQRLYLSNNGLYEIPSLLPSSLNELILANNFLNNLPNVPTPLDKLQKLDLCGNNFKNLTAQNFYAPNLGYLCLGDQITTFDENAFRGQTALHTLELKSKDLTIESILRYVSFIPNLQRLSLYYVHANEGEESKNVAYKLSNLKHLQMIQVHGTVHPELFLSMPNLEILDLHASPQLANSIINSDDMLDNLVNLTTLRLQETDISVLEERHLIKLTRLKKLSLVSNPIHCDCKLKWLVSRILTLDIELEHLSQTVCNSPNHLYAQRLTSDDVLKEICIPLNQSRSAKGFGVDHSADNQSNNTSNYQPSKHDDDINLSHVLYAIIGLGALVIILIIVVIVVVVIPKWRKRRKRERHSRQHRNSLDLLPHRNGSFDVFSADNAVVPYNNAKTPPEPPVRCTSTTFKRRTSEDVAC